MLLSEETSCFCFLAGHESFAAAEGAIKIALNANKVRKNPLQVILNGLGKDAAFIISRINGFTYCKTEFDPYTEEVKVVSKTAYSNGPRANVRCYGADNVPEGVAIMKLEHVGVSITMGRMHSDAQFAGSSSVPAHVEMMGLIGMGNNPMVGATVAVAVAVEESQKNK